MNTRRYRIAPGEKVDLGSLPTVPSLVNRGKSALREMLDNHVTRFAELQEAMYAESRQALLLVFQGMDASGKDSTIKHVTTGVNPQAFGSPTSVNPPTRIWNTATCTGTG